jgi:23S rRNA pseudouridine1911/1915/1917 synthase
MDPREGPASGDAANDDTSNTDTSDTDGPEASELEADALGALAADADPADAGALDVVVPELLDGVRLDRAVAMLTGLTRAESSALVAAGLVAVAGRAATKGSVPLVAGQRLTATLPPPDDGEVAPDPDVALDVVLEDPDFLVIDKPAGLVVHPGAGHRTGTLVAGLLARYPELAALGALDGAGPHRPGIVHRLDRGTSGLLAVARTPLAYDALRAQLASRSMSRVYLGLVEGDVKDEAGVIDAPIGRSQRTPTKMAVRAGGRPSVTSYAVLRRSTSPPRTLLELRLETGRTHQIRVHLAAIGRPVVNDPRYGRAREPALEEGRVFLHATSLGFAHPATGEPVQIDSPLPPDLTALLEAPSA